MLNELQNLVLTKKEKQLQVFINQLTNELYNNEKIEVDSKKLLELLSYLTSNENISKQMESAVEDIHRRTTDILNKKQTEKFKDYIKYLEENSIPKQKVKDVLQNNRNELFSTTYIDDKQYKPYTMQIDRINKIENELLEDK